MCFLQTLKELESEIFTSVSSLVQENPFKLENLGQIRKEFRSITQPLIGFFFFNGVPPLVIM